MHSNYMENHVEYIGHTIFKNHLEKHILNEDLGFTFNCHSSAAPYLEQK